MHNFKWITIIYTVVNSQAKYLCVLLSWLAIIWLIGKLNTLIEFKKKIVFNKFCNWSTIYKRYFESKPK